MRASEAVRPDLGTFVQDGLYNILFVCSGNSARSILAESILRKQAAGRFRAFSAGTHPKGEVDPLTTKVLRSFDCEIEGLHSKSWDVFARPDAPELHFVFTVCDVAAAEICPVWRGRPVVANWGVEDPAAVEGAALFREAAFVRAFRHLKNRIDAFTSLPLAGIDRMLLEAKLREIRRADELAGEPVPAGG
jgi:arsenate reductase